VIFDPYEDGSVPGLLPVRERADMVLCSHDHHDHRAKENVELIHSRKNPFAITELDTFHDDRGGSLRGKNMIRILDDGHMRIAHMGDQGCDLTKAQTEQLRGLDLVMVPVGGYYTIDARWAKRIMDQLHPGIIVPMHYRGEGFGFEVLETVEKFTDLYAAEAVIHEGSSIEIAKITASRVAVMEPLSASRK